MPSPTVPRAITLALVLAVGAALGVHGLNAPKMSGVALSNSGAGKASAGVQGRTAAATSGNSAQGSAGASQGGSSAAGSSGTSGSSGSGGSSGSSGSSGAQSTSKGPLLSTTQYAPFTYEVYPSPASQVQQAEDGFTLTIKAGSNGQKTLDIGNASGNTLATKTFLATDRVYWVETSYGDDAPGADANYGDDGYLLTDAQGYITHK